MLSEVIAPIDNSLVEEAEETSFFKETSMDVQNSVFTEETTKTR